MPIALDASSDGGSSGTSPLAWNHTCTGSNLILIVGVTVRAGAIANCTGVTFNSVPLAVLGLKKAFGQGQASLWYLVAPPSGTHQISVAFTGNPTLIAEAGAVSFTGVKQTGQPDASAQGSGASATPNINVNTVADKCWVISQLYKAVSTEATPSKTQRWSHALSTTDWGAGQDTNGPKTPAGTQNLGWTTTGTPNYAIVIASIAPIASSILKVAGVAQASILKVSGVSNATAKKVEGVANV